MEISGCKAKEKIHDGIRKAVYRKTKDGNASPPLPVIIKVIKEENPDRNDIARLKNEYEIVKNLSIAGIVKPYGLIKDNGVSR